MQRITTIKSFLESVQLQQYHSAIINAGATDQDLSQLISFDDQELGEFISALDMLPFHSIKFRKCLRELKSSISQEEAGEPTSNIGALTNDNASVNDLSSPSTREFIINHATIYGKKRNRQLTSYEEAINNAALQLALENPLLISKKGELFDLAKKKLLENGYRYKRGSSRSKLKDDNKKSSQTSDIMDNQQLQAQQEQQQRDILAKRQENAQRMSMKRLEKIKVLQFQVEQALQCRQNTENKLASGDCFDKLSRLSMEADLMHYEETKVSLTKEISKLKAQERKHQWYKRRKLERSASQSTDEGFSSQASSSYMEDDQAPYFDDRQSAFSVCAPTFSSIHPYSTTPYHSSQEYNADDEGPRTSVPSSSSSSSTTSTTATVITCSRESDVRASLISNYDR